MFCFDNLNTIIVINTYKGNYRMVRVKVIKSAAVNLIIICTQDNDTMLVQWCPSVVDDGPTLI